MRMSERGRRVLLMVLTVALGLALVLLVTSLDQARATPAEGQTCKDVGFDDNLDESTSGEWGSVDFDPDEEALKLTVNEGYEVRLCIKAGSAQQGLGPETTDWLGEGEYVVEHSSGKELSHYGVLFQVVTTTTQPDEETTTTWQDTTTTTTASESTTTTTSDTPTTSTIPDGSSTSTLPPPSSSTTTPDDTSTTSLPAPTTTVSSPSTTPSGPGPTLTIPEAPRDPATPAETLPFTGVPEEAKVLGAVAGLLGLAGVTLLAFSGRTEEEEG